MSKPQSKNDWYTKVHQISIEACITQTKILSSAVYLTHLHWDHQQRPKTDSEHIIPGLENGSSPMEGIWLLLGDMQQGLHWDLLWVPLVPLILKVKIPAMYGTIRITVLI